MSDRQWMLYKQKRVPMGQSQMDNLEALAKRQRKTIHYYAKANTNNVYWPPAISTGQIFDLSDRQDD